MEIVYTLEQLPQTANAFWKIAEKAQVIALHGKMGAGKTTFIHALCDAKSVKDVVSSPTFSIINEYRLYENGLEKAIYHIDLYRMNHEDEARQPGIEDCLFSGDICLLEWPEKAHGL